MKERMRERMRERMKERRIKFQTERKEEGK
jgi:hypothetical protein